MPDLQTEIFKKVLPQMNNLKYDDEDPAPEVTVVAEPSQPVNVTKEIWQYVKDNPGLRLGPIRQAMESIASSNISTRLCQMAARGNIIRKPSDEGFVYYASQEYKSMSKQESIAYAKTIKEQKKKDKLNRLMNKPKTIARKPVQPVPASAPAQPLAVPTYDPSVVATWPLEMAKAYYVELKKYFGEA